MQTRTIQMTPEVSYNLELVVDDIAPTKSYILASIWLLAQRNGNILHIARHPDISVFSEAVVTDWGMHTPQGRVRTRGFPIDLANVGGSVAAANEAVIAELTPLVAAILARKAEIARIESEFAGAIQALGL